MQTIDQDTIDFAYDFFFKLSEGQIIERMESWNKMQPVLNFFFKGIRKPALRKDQVQISEMFYLMIDYCFTSFYGKIPIVENQTIRDRLAWVINDIKTSPNPDGLVDYPRDMALTGQLLLMKFVEEKLEAYIHESKLFIENDATDLFGDLINMTFLYNQEVERMATK